MDSAQTVIPTCPDRPQLPRARVVACWVIIPVLSIVVCVIAGLFAAAGHDLRYTISVHPAGRTPFLEEFGMGIGAILGLGASVVWCRRIISVERATPGVAKPVRWATLLALLATAVLHLSLMFLQAFLRNAPVHGDGLVFGAFFGIPTALISASVLGSIGYHALAGARR